jgi:hypothetical protein
MCNPSSLTKPFQTNALARQRLARMSLINLLLSLHTPVQGVVSQSLGFYPFQLRRSKPFAHHFLKPQAVLKKKSTWDQYRVTSQATSRAIFQGLTLNLGDGSWGGGVHEPCGRWSGAALFVDKRTWISKCLKLSSHVALGCDDVSPDEEAGPSGQ